jgi:hypothetical protein
MHFVPFLLYLQGFVASSQKQALITLGIPCFMYCRPHLLTHSDL